MHFVISERMVNFADVIGDNFLVIVDFVYHI